MNLNIILCEKGRTNMRFPEAFKKGDTVAMTATSFPMGPEVIKQCVRALEEEGYRVKLSRCIKEGRNFHNYLAGDGKSRAEDLHELFADSEVKAIFCLRGGYGSSHMMRYLDFDLIRKYPKPFIGYSDVTNLNVALNQFCDLVTFHGPMVYSNMVCSYDAYTKNSLYRALHMGEEMEFENPEGKEYEVIREGKAQGTIIGGNITVLARGIGTFFQADTKGKILFLEEIEENIPSIDMFLTQMEYAGMLKDVRGTLFGNFTECTNNRYDASYTIDQFLRDRMRQYEIPIMAGVQSGHDAPMGTIPLGTVCCMDTEKKKIIFKRP